MGRSDVVRAALTACLAMMPLADVGHADSPLPPPARETVWSANNRFFAVMEPDKRITTIYRATREKDGEKVWSMFGWFRVAALADDGEHLVAGYDGSNLIPLDYDKREVMLYFFKRGELIHHVTLDQILQDFSRLQRTVSHYHWGYFEGFDDAGRYVLQTVEGRRIRYDVRTGLPIPEGSRPVPPGTISTQKP